MTTGTNTGKYVKGTGGILGWANWSAEWAELDSDGARMRAEKDEEGSGSGISNIHLLNPNLLSGLTPKPGPCGFC